MIGPSINLSFTGYHLRRLPQVPPSQPTCAKRLLVAAIQEAVSRHYQISVKEMWSARRSRCIARPRQVAMWLCKQLTAQSLPEIGRRFGNRDHTTVIHAIRQIDRLRREDPEIGRDVELLLDALSAS